MVSVGRDKAEEQCHYQRFGCREFVWEMNPKTTDDTMQKMRQRGREGKCGLPLEYATSEDSPENCCLP